MADEQDEIRDRLGRFRPGCSGNPRGRRPGRRSDVKGFVRALEARLREGAEEYGNRSFERPTAELLGELQEEALDLAGWGFVLWERLRRLQENEAGVDRSEGSMHEKRNRKVPINRQSAGLATKRVD